MLQLGRARGDVRASQVRTALLRAQNTGFIQERTCRLRMNTGLVTKLSSSSSFFFLFF